MKKEFAIFIIAILIFSNVSIAQVYAQSSGTNPGRVTRDFTDPRFNTALSDPRLRSGVALGGGSVTLGTNQERDLGEDIIINVAQNVPDRLRASLLEKQDVYVRSLLIGLPSNPSITIPKIRSATIRVTNVTTEPADKKVRVTARYVNTRSSLGVSNQVKSDPTFNNLGYIQTIIRRVPKEDDVPDTIKVNLDATINFDVSEGLGFGPREDVLIEQTEQEWLKEKDQHSFFGGFIRASEVKSDRASFIVYDENLNPLTNKAITIGEGATSGVVLRGGYSRYGNLFNRFRIKVNDIRSIGEKAKLHVFRDSTGESLIKILKKGSSLYPGSNWVLEDIRIKKDKTKGEIKEVLLRNTKTRDRKTLTLQQVNCGTLKAQECINFNNVCSLIGTTCVQRTECSKLNKNNCEVNPQCSFNTQSNSCVGKSITTQNIKSCSSAGGSCYNYFCPTDNKEVQDKSNSCGSFEIDNDDASPTKLNRVCCVSLTEQDKSLVIQKNDLDNQIKKYGEIAKDKNSDSYLSELDLIINDVKKVFNQQTKVEIRSRATNLLKSILADLNNIRRVYQGSSKEGDKERLKKVTETIENLVSFLGEHQSLQLPVSGIDTPKTVEELYNLAIQEYDKSAREFPNLKSEDNNYYSVKALNRIAEIYDTQLNDLSRSIQAYEALLNNPNLGKDKQIISNKVNLLKSILKNFGTKPIKIPDADGEIRVILLDVPNTPRDLERKATIEINNVRKVVRINEVLVDNADESFKWRVKAIGETSNSFRSSDVVTIERVESNSRGGTTTRSSSITNNLQSLAIGKDTKGKTKNVKVKLISLDLKRETHITIVPDSERAVSQSSFSLNIPIEKRAIKPFIFSNSLDEEINKTKKLVEKVDKLIKNMEKIHKFWINFCYVTFGVLWSKNLIQNSFLSNQGIAREKIRDKWVDDYNTARSNKTNPYKKSFDQFVLKNREKYEKDLENAESIIDRIQAGEHNSAVNKDMTKASEDQKKDWFFAQQMHESNKDDVRYFDAKINADINTRVAHIDSELDELGKDYNKIKDKLKDCELGHIKSTEYNQNKIGYLNTCRTRSISKILSEYFVGNKDGNLPDSVAIDRANNICGGSCKQTFIQKFKDTYDSFRGVQKREYGISDTILDKQGNRKIVLGYGNSKQLYVSDENCKSSKPTSISKIETKKPYFIKEEGKDTCRSISLGVTPKFKHNPKFSTVQSTDSSRNKGLIKFISIDSLLYAQVAYTSSNVVKSVTIFERTKQNGPLGTGLLLGNIKDVQKKCKQAIEYKSSLSFKASCSSIDKVKREIDTCNSQLSKKLLEVGGKCKKYSKENTQPTAVGKSCVDFMTPGDCALLFNACDPVLCPSSRCNFGGTWHVKDVTQTGIAGSLALCAPNFGNPADGGVAVPICLTGLLAGLNNIKSMLEGYGECLSVSKVSKQSVGICDKIRNVYLCDILWREGIAILNVQGGLLGLLSEKLFDEGKGGGEYANFKNAIGNSVNGLKFFTQDYAKNVFASYSGGSLDEIGTEICKTAVFGKLPGTGFFDQITRPVSPPQFTAVLEEIPYSDVGRKESQYSVFHHIYAGANEDIRFSVYLKSVNEVGQSQLPIQYILGPSNRKRQNIPLAKGSFSDENNEFVALSGYNQVCIEISNRVSGRSQQPNIVECGFGKVSTNFGIDYLNDKLIEREALKKITTATQCRPEAGRLTNLNYQNGIGISDVVASAPGAVVGSFSTGLLQTGIVRKCSGFNPGIGTSEKSWVAVGTCGKDERDRDLGICWLYQPGLSKLIQDTQRRALVEQGLKATQQKLAEQGIRGLNVLTDLQIDEKLAIITKLLDDPSESNFKQAIALYREIIVGTLIETKLAKSQFNLAETYEKWAKFRKKDITTKSQAQEIIKNAASCPVLAHYNESKGKYDTIELNCPSSCKTNVGCFCELTSTYTKGVCVAQGLTINHQGEELFVENGVTNMNNLIASGQSGRYKYEKGKWVKIVEGVVLNTNVAAAQNQEDKESSIDCLTIHSCEDHSEDECKNKECGFENCAWNENIGKCYDKNEIKKSTLEVKKITRTSYKIKDKLSTTDTGLDELIIVTNVYSNGRILARGISGQMYSFEGTNWEKTEVIANRCNQCGDGTDNICDRNECHVEIGNYCYFTRKTFGYLDVSKTTTRDYFGTCNSCTEIIKKGICIEYNRISNDNDRKEACIGPTKKQDVCGIGPCSWKEDEKVCMGT